MSWGPTHQTPPKQRRYHRRLIGGLAVVWLLVVLSLYSSHEKVAEVLFYVGILAVIIRAVTAVTGVRGRHDGKLAFPGWWRSLKAKRHRVDPRDAVRGYAAGVHLGVGQEGQTRRTSPERAVLVLGPPRSGKTSAIIIPTLLSYPGAVVSTSTKPDVMRATHTSRAKRGQVWQFDPTGTTRPADGVQTLRWSPAQGALDWDGALLMARAMVTGAQVGTGTTDVSHWTRRAQALLAPLLHAAAVSGQGVADVVDWVSRHEIDEPGAALTEHDGARLAVGQLVGLRNTEARERSSIFSAAADALEAYTSQAALDAAESPNFFAGRFVASRDTIYIHAPAEHQALAAPMVCGLLAEIRRATYAQHRDQTLRQPVLFALDEVANIAPIPELPQIASEGASQGLILLAALQDLSQARNRWGQQADGFLTLFGTKLLLGGIADQKTLEAVSIALGEFDRRMVTRNVPNSGPGFFAPRGTPRPNSTTSYSTQRQRRVSPGDVAAIPYGKALHLHDVLYELVALTPAHEAEPWRRLTTPAATGNGSPSTERGAR